MSAFQQGAALGSAPMVEVVGAKDPSGNAAPLELAAAGAASALRVAVLTAAGSHISGTTPADAAAGSSPGLNATAFVQGYNGAAWDRLRTASSSGAGLGALKAHAQNETNLTLLTSAARTATGQGTAVTGLGAYKSATFLLDVTAAAADAADTLDVYVEYSPDGGTVWDNLVHFTQVLGDGGAKQFVAHVSLWGATPDAMHALGAALAAGSVRNVDFGDRLRVRWEITDGGTGGNVGFTFAVKGSFKS